MHESRSRYGHSHYKKNASCFLLQFLFWNKILADDHYGLIKKCGTGYETVYTTVEDTFYEKRCSKVSDRQCKTVYDTSFETSIQTQCTPTYSTECKTVYQTGYKKYCTTVHDEECRITYATTYKTVYDKQCSTSYRKHCHDEGRTNKVSFSM